MASTSPFVVNDDVEHLDVPPISVVATEDFIIGSLWSVIQYFGNSYPDHAVRRQTKTLTRDDLQAFSRDEGGWRPKQESLTEISNQVSSITLSMNSWPGNTPKTLMEIAEFHLERYCPLIAFVDAYQVFREKSGSGPIYTIVVAGRNASQSLVIDPWAGRKKVVDNQKLETAWDPELHQVIEITVDQDNAPQGGLQ